MFILILFFLLCPSLPVALSQRVSSWSYVSISAFYLSCNIYSILGQNLA